MTWLGNGFTVGMPHMVPGQLSEVEMLKLLGDCQWQGISAILGMPSQEIANDQGERLYASFINVQVSLGGRTFADFGEGADVQIRSRCHLYARRFVEGVLFFDDKPIPDEALPTEITREALVHATVPYVYMTNAFVTRETSNLRLRTFIPAGGEPSAEATVEQMPFGIRDHEEMQRTGEVTAADLEGATLVPGMERADVTYEIVPESDLNGAGLLYFARYLAIMNYGERRVLRERGAVPVSAQLVSNLSTDRRRIFYFGNADANDSVRIQVSVYVTGADDAGSATTEVPMRLHFVTELYRLSDGALMAKSITRKSLSLPRRAKRLIYEATRLRRLWGQD